MWCAHLMSRGPKCFQGYCGTILSDMAKYLLFPHFSYNRSYCLFSTADISLFIGISSNFLFEAG